MAIITEVPGSLNVAALVASGAISAATLAASGIITATGNLLKDASTGESIAVQRATVSHTTDSGTGTETLTALIPAGAIVVGAVARITTILAGTSLVTFDIGDSGVLDRYGSTILIAADTTVDETDYVADPAGTWSASARNIVLTATAGQFDSGVIRVSVFYHAFTAPAS